MPNTIEENIERLKATVPAIKNSIITKGGTVNSGDGLEEFADDILSIKNELTDITITSNGEYYSGEETTLTTTTFPVTVSDATGVPLKHVDVIGNANQSGTPTPDNPIMPQGTGERTRNLCNESTIQNGHYGVSGNYSEFTANTKYRCFKSDLPAGTYTLNIVADEDMHILRCSNSVDGAISVYKSPPYTFTLSADATIYVSWRNTDITDSFTNMKVMLNSGSQPLIYEPYGYEIPISNGRENLADTLMGGINLNDGSDVSYDTTRSQIRSSYIPCTQKTDYALSATQYPVQNVVAFYDANKNYLSRTAGVPLTQGRVFTTPNNAAYMRTTFFHTTGGQLYPYIDGVQIMLNRGSTPLPYEPYHHTTTTTYLGEVQTTRKVKKLVLTGEEDWTRIILSDGSAFYTNIMPPAISTQSIDIYCTHYKASRSNENYVIRIPSVANRILIFHKEIATITDFKAYLADQYAAGTPVTVWYVLAESEVGVVNEPLMKIGDYADELSIDTNIPLTQNAKNIINIDTTLKPSSASFTYNKKGTYIGYNKITVSVSDVVDGRIFIVTTIPNATVTLINTSNTYTQTADNTGEAVFENISAGTYTITATYDDAVSDTTTITVVEHSIVEDTFATLTISASGNTTITVTNGTIAKTLTYTGTPIVQYVSLGTWDLSCEIDGITVTRTVSVDTYTNQDILLEPIPQTVSRYVNFTSNTTTITGDPDTHPVYMGINRCNVSDDGTINAYYGDVSYTEDGSNGQVMVKIPKFYYKVTPDSDGGLDGANIRKCTWEISDIPQTGFTLHPAFYDANGNEIDYFLYGAFDAVGQNSEGAYDTSYNTSSDKLSSVAGSTYVPSNSMTRATARTMAANRGTGWYQAAVKQTMAVQMLFVVEHGFNSQVAVGKGVTNASAATYAGQTTGNITSGTQSNETTPVNWRGIENFWGNIFDWIDGLNINERVPYVCDNYTFVDNTSTGYTQISFSLPVSNYITALGYDSTNDWVMLPSESSSTSNPNGPIGDYVYSNAGWRVALLGGRWTAGSNAGAFFWSCAYTSSITYTIIGTRLMYIPSAV